MADSGGTYTLQISVGVLVVIAGIILRRKEMQWDVGRVIERNLDGDKLALFSASVPSLQTKILNGGFAICGLHSTKITRD